MPRTKLRAAPCYQPANKPSPQLMLQRRFRPCQLSGPTFVSGSHCSQRRKCVGNTVAVWYCQEGMDRPSTQATGSGLRMGH